MRLNYSLFHKKVSSISLLKETNERESHDFVVHRSRNCVLQTGKREKDRVSSAPGCGFQSEIGKEFKPYGEIHSVSPIYDQISKSFFGEVENPSVLQLFDRDFTIKPKIRTITAESRLKPVSFLKDPQIEVIKSRINTTNKRLQHSKAGKSASVTYESAVNSNSSIIDKPKVPKKSYNKRETVLKEARNISFEQKLMFYNEDLSMSKRREKTEHFPWNEPENPQLPSTPENSKFYTIIPEIKSKFKEFKRRKGICTRQKMDFLSNPKALGKKGGRLLLQMVNDEKNNVQTSKAEIEEFNKAIFCRTRTLKLEENSWKAEQRQFAVDKCRMKKTRDANFLIRSYFCSK
jgi:hypothetical protein